MSLTDKEKLMLDHERAQNYGTKYLARIQKALFDRGQYLTLAMDGFNEFVKLPKADHRASAIWDLAFNVLATAVPALRLAKFVTDQHKAATLALAIAEATGEKYAKAKAVKVVTGAALKGGQVANKVNDVKGKVGGIKESYDKVTAADPASEAKSELSKRLDASRKVIKDLINDGNLAIEAWEKALDAELKTLENRLSGADKTTKKSQEDYMKELLQDPPALSDSELDQVESRYLWLMIGQYCRDNVKIVHTTNISVVHTIGGTQEHRSGPHRSIEGLNNTQQATLVEWFGSKTRRGKYFSEIVVTNAYDFLRAVRVPEENKVNRDHSYSETMK